ncbi:MAG: 3-hydroxyacyl-[acyl-carrier-protein] dehydratase FabZ [Deltaproteobacteria bacterium]|nr:MAG: 3-hydroxyacyl-[acyl-carrier-protein] dehydratase FabZ [Deltaproteobacteria bacterium]RUA03130.1 MAG: 3-hydroxyacyl-[acyl-carrier-protein] dehydratase FabZ [Deltaproteobacteria bacterium]
MKKTYDIRGIMERLPHRYPFLLVDRIIDLIPGKKVIALKNVTMNEPFFMGHFPREPVMPGVLILEAMAQAGGVLTFESVSEEKKKTMTFYFSTMDGVRFRKLVVPGDQLIFEIELLRMRSNAVKMAGTAKVDGALVAEGQMMASIGSNK